LTARFRLAIFSIVAALLSFQIAEKVARVPRRSSPTETHSFEGCIHSSDGHLVGPVTGLFFRGFEKGVDLRWRGEFRWTSQPNKTFIVGDSAVLRRDGCADAAIVIMDVAGTAVGFRCCGSVTPLMEVI